MPKSPDKPRSAKNSPKKPKDYARPTRAKAHRPDAPKHDPALDELLNPGIAKGTAGMGSGTGLQQPPDNSFDRRADRARRAHRARLHARRLPAKSRKAAMSRARRSKARRYRDSIRRWRGNSASSPTRMARCRARRSASAASRIRTRSISAAASPAPPPRNAALENLLRDGRAEFNAQTWMPHRPPRPEKSEGGLRLEIKSELEPKGDQPTAIRELVEGANRHERMQVLLGVTGSGKTYTMAKVIEATQRPALVLAPNKTLAAQLYGEFKSFFPDNAVEYFVSYYDYYQPEAYIPRTDTYIEKDSSINEQIDRMRHSATRALLERDDVIIVASVSCIYGIGSVETYSAMTFSLKKGGKIEQRQLIADLVALQYKRTPDFSRGTFRVRGDTIEIFPAHYEDRAWRVSLFGDEIEKIAEFDPLTGRETDELKFVKIYANSHYVTPRPTLIQAMNSIKAELKWRLDQLDESRPPAGSAAARAAHHLRSGNDGSHRRLRRHRELFALSHRPQARRAAADAVRICARQRAGVRRRKPCHHSADRRHVPRRLPAQGDAGGIRLPPAVLHGQPAAALRGMGRDAAADRRGVGDAEFVGDRPGRRRVRRAGDPPHRLDRSAGRYSPRAHPGRRSGRRGARHRAEGLSLAGHGADQAHGRGPDRISARAGHPRALHASATSTPSSASRSSAICGSAPSMRWSASTCCARASTFPNARWSRSSMPTRKASCAARPR